MAIERMPIGKFVNELEAALLRKDGYIMGATGQDPKKWSEKSWWYAGQYKGEQLKKALYWRENAQRVWDCNGLAEGIYRDYAGVDINTKARYNYSGWCGIRGKGTIPAERRVPGAAVFWGDKPDAITHVGYLYKPVSANKPDGDWYLIEARGVTYGVVKTKLSARKPKYWGWMTKYFDYEATTETNGFATLSRGDVGDDVKRLQELLLARGYELPEYGADGDFGAETKAAVRAFQADREREPTGICDAATYDALLAGYALVIHAGLDALLEARKKYGGELVRADGDCD